MPGLLAQVHLSIAEAEDVLRGLVLASRRQLRERARTPLYESGIRYRREGQGPEGWKTIDQLYADGVGDCEDLSIARVAELAEQGIGARVLIVPTRPGRYHAIVEKADGEREDPSRILMAQERASVGDADMMAYMGEPPSGKEIAVEVEQIGPKRFRVYLITRVGREAIAIPGSGKSKAQAFQRAAQLTEQIVSNPVVSAVLPPGSAKAIAIAAELAQRYKGGGLDSAREFAKQLTGAGARRLMKAIF